MSLNASSTAYWTSYGPLRPSAIRLAGAIVQGRTEHSCPIVVGWNQQDPGRGQSDYRDVASGFPMEGTMRAPIPTPAGLPAQAAIIIMGCRFVFFGGPVALRHK